MGVISFIIGIIIILYNLFGIRVETSIHEVYQAVGLVFGSVFTVGGIICIQISGAKKKILEALEKGNSQRAAEMKNVADSIDMIFFAASTSQQK